MKLISKISFLAFLLFIYTNAFANDMDEVTNIINDASTAGKQSVGVVLQWVFAIGFPLICIGGFMVLGYTIAKKKVEQTQDGHSRIPTAVFIGALVGVFVYVVVTMLIFQVITGDMTNAATVVTDFYKEALGL
ncbi:hypothetical protein [Campylobacter sp. US33a]|uniref:hypothetical protein n=1 Tax=Campylobacter sp. US33a TaxID=2498120 RepID=UPI001068730F|nr:hypothetical protein [Campylobacter sp. US33a]TEY00724.1 hypothetical protein ELQ16_08805 [Campylobacter sp. US33a]